ncbi:MAG TPA: glycosyltransferase, partial [Ignavibacteria bacterium]|nr:glycosyltransferase [Ignavibacteria bacterium]
MCEVEPPDWFKYFKRDYAAGPQGDIHTGKVSDGNITWKRGYVWGAGMVVRKSAWDKLIADGFKTSMSCRKGAELSSGGDSEACYALVLAGWEVWYDPRLKLKHCMPAGRLDWNYLTRLFVGFGVASVGLEPYEKAIQLGRADISEEEIMKQDWRFEFKKTIKALRKYGLKKILSLRFPQVNNTDILMLEFNISRLKELLRVRKDYDKNFNELIKAPWKKDYTSLKATHRKYIESENDFRYGWPWGEETHINNYGINTFPKISILSPSFNSEGTIEKAILSVLKQGYPNFEHIIYDGGSKDGTVEILKKYPHLKWVSEPDRGQSDAMNKAFNSSTGEIIAYLNVDDYFQRGAFHKIAKAFEENPSAEMVVGNLFFEYGDHTFTRKSEIEYKKIMLPFIYMFPINPVSYFYKRNVQTEIGPFPLDNHLTMDYWFLLKAFQKHKLIKIEDFLGTFCMNGYNKTSNANNRKNTHHRVVYHCWHYDRKNLPYYLYNYYKFFYYEKKPYNLGKVSHKLKRNLKRVYSLLTLKKNKHYSERLFEQSRNRYYEKKRIRSIANLSTSFIIYPKGLFQKSRQSQFLYSLLGHKYSEKAKLAYFFFTTPPGLPLANKLYYYGTEFKNNKKSFKGNSLLFLTYLISPTFPFKKNDGSSKSGTRGLFYYLNPVNWIKGFINFFRYKKYKEVSYNYFLRAGDKYYFHKNFQATILMILSFMFYPLSITKRSNFNLFSYSALGNTITDKLRFGYHMYKDNPEYSFAHKLNYYGNELRKEGSSFKGNMFLILCYIISPKYISKRETIEKSKIVYVSNFIEDKRKISFSPSRIVSNSYKNILQVKYKSRRIKTNIRNARSKLGFKIKSVYYYFRYRKFKAKSKILYAQ